MIFCVAHCFVIVGVTHYEATKTASRNKYAEWGQPIGEGDVWNGYRGLKENPLTCHPLRSAPLPPRLPAHFRSQIIYAANWKIQVKL